MALILDVWRPTQRPVGGDGYTTHTELADHLVVKLDRNEDGRVIGVLEVQFADHTGLQTEWENQTTPTILAAAVLANISTVDFPTDQLAAAQKAIISAQIAIA